MFNIKDIHLYLKNLSQVEEKLRKKSKKKDLILVSVSTLHFQAEQDLYCIRSRDNISLSVLVPALVGGLVGGAVLLIILIVIVVYAARFVLY